MQFIVKKILLLKRICIPILEKKCDENILLIMNSYDIFDITIPIKLANMIFNASSHL